MQPGEIIEVGGVSYVRGADGALYPNDPPAGDFDFVFAMRDPSAKSTRTPNKWPGLKEKGRAAILGHAYDPASEADDDAIGRHMREWGRFDSTPPDESSYEDVQAFLNDWLRSRDFTVPASTISKYLTMLRQARKDKYLRDQPR